MTAHLELDDVVAHGDHVDFRRVLRTDEVNLRYSLDCLIQLPLQGHHKVTNLGDVVLQRSVEQLVLSSREHLVVFVHGLHLVSDQLVLFLASVSHRDYFLRVLCAGQVCHRDTHPAFPVRGWFVAHGSGLGVRVKSCAQEVLGRLAL